MRIAVALFGVLVLGANGEGDRTLTLPHTPRAGEIALIEVQVGSLARGQEIHVTTAAGRELGVISPFNVRSGRAAGTYPIPVPADAVAGRRLTVRLTVTGNGVQPHAPSAREVRSVEVVIGGAAVDQSDNEEKK